MDISTDRESDELRDRFHFVYGPRFEVFYGLQTMLEDGPVHGTWRERALRDLPPQFSEAFTRLGSAPKIWPLIADAPGAIDPTISFEELFRTIGDIDIATFRRGMLIGVLHDPGPVDDLIAGRKTLEQVIASAPEQKQQGWFTCVGLYPYQATAPLVVALQRLVDDAVGFRTDALLCLRLFWDHIFASTWKQLAPAFERSTQERRRLFEATTVEQFLERILMRLEIGDDRRVLRAMRGGCEVAIDTLVSINISPSVFNAGRLWTTYDDRGGKSVYLPVVDPVIGVDAGDIHAQPSRTALSADPAIIFKALGDGTRYAMMRLIGAQPRSSTELARELKVSKATISHHLSLLREAGLVHEEAAAGAVRLSLRREVLAELSSLAAGAFGSEPGGSENPL